MYIIYWFVEVNSEQWWNRYQLKTHLFFEFWNSLLQMRYAHLQERAKITIIFQKIEQKRTYRNGRWGAEKLQNAKRFLLNFIKGKHSGLPKRMWITKKNFPFEGFILLCHRGKTHYYWIFFNFFSSEVVLYWKNSYFCRQFELKTRRKL